MVNGEVGGNAAQEELVGFVERIENLIESRKEINDGIKDVRSEAKSRGYDARTIMEVIKIRAAKKASKAKYQERQSLLETYLAAFGIDEGDE